jgi:hypothetical protein
VRARARRGEGGRESSKSPSTSPQGSVTCSRFAGARLVRLRGSFSLGASSRGARAAGSGGRAIGCACLCVCGASGGRQEGLFEERSGGAARSPPPDRADAPLAALALFCAAPSRPCPSPLPTTDHFFGRGSARLVIHDERERDSAHTHRESTRREESEPSPFFWGRALCNLLPARTHAPAEYCGPPPREPRACARDLSASSRARSPRARARGARGARKRERREGEQRGEKRRRSTQQLPLSHPPASQGRIPPARDGLGSQTRPQFDSGSALACGIAPEARVKRKRDLAARRGAQCRATSCRRPRPQRRRSRC